MATILIFLCHSNAQNADTAPPHPSQPPHPYITNILKRQYNRNATINNQPIPTHQEVMTLIGSEVGEVIYFLIANENFAIPEDCEQCVRGDTYIWKYQKMRTVL